MTRSRLGGVGAYLALAASIAAPAHAQFGRMMGGRFAASAGLVMPVGDLDKAAVPGFDISIRTGASSEEPWSYRGGITFTRFGGKDSVRSYQMFGFGGDIVHHSSSRFYQYLGFAFDQVKQTLESSGAQPFIGSNTRSESDFGVTGGVGINLGAARSGSYVEFGVTNVFGDVHDFSWFPVRIGVRF